MRSIISALLLCVSTAWAVAQETKPIELQPDAPDRHIVVKGDTLWGISSMFLKDPYRWPEIWRLNKEQIKNPHWIYPGQVVILDRSGATPQLKLGKLVGEEEGKLEPKVYSEPIKHEIPAIPQDKIEPFLTRPLVIEEGALDDAPRIVATQENRVNVGAGDEFFVKGAKDADKLWNVYRPGQALKDPESGETLGYEALYLGSARKTRDGDVATFEVATSKEEIGRGDRLVPIPKPEIISYVPHAPDHPVKAWVMSVYGTVAEGGTYSIIAVSCGKREGIEVGHVLALSRAGVTATDHMTNESVQLPEERYGLVFVFRVFDRISYALVMNVKRPVSRGDAVSTP